MENMELIERIRKLKQQRRAVILAHNYQIPEVQDIADYVGDSLGLSQQAAQTETEVIVFCGVHFMAETAFILSPDKVVLMPDKTAGCPMADMITSLDLRNKKKDHPRAKVICYVNSTAEVKAESDICCTSANAVEVVNSLGQEEEIIFIPDQYLGDFVSKKAQRELILWPGFCPTHVKILPEHVEEQKRKYPQAKVIVHPECTSPVIGLADEVLSTGGMVSFARRTEARQVIVGTEIGLLHRLGKENPGKEFYPASKKAVCPSMKKNNLEKILFCLEDMEPEVKVPEKVRIKAKAAIEKMLIVGRGEKSASPTSK